MITENMLTTLKVVSADYNNVYFQKYLKFETMPKHTCPVCNTSIEEFIDFRQHVLTQHKEHLGEPTIVSALNPVARVRLACDMRKDTERLTVGKLFGDIITSAHNQHALINIIGKTGMGKSNAAMRIGTEVSKYIAQKLGGKPEDYFNIDNIAIMKLDSIIPIMENLDKKQYNVIILDDIGASYSARDFQKAINKNINKIFQTFRDTNTLVMLTMPDTFLIDKVARKLAHFQIEIVEKRHDQKISIGKLTQLVEQYRGSNKTHYHFIVDSNGVKYPKIVFKRVDSELAEAYEKKRSEIRQSMMQDNIEAIKRTDADGEEEDTGIALNKLPPYMQIAGDVDVELTINPSISARALGEKFNVSKDTALKAKNYVIALRKEKIAQSGEVKSVLDGLPHNSEYF